MFLYKFLPAGKFQLDGIPCFFINNTDMAAFHINLRNLSMIFHLFFGKEIGGIGFLQQGIPHMLFVFQDVNYCRRIPFLRSHAPFEPLIFQPFCNLLWALAPKKFPVNSPYDFCLPLIDDQFSIHLIIAQELMRVHVHLTFFEFGSYAPFTVL